VLTLNRYTGWNHSKQPNRLNQLLFVANVSRVHNVGLT
jgi:hypothetical protein